MAAELLDHAIHAGRQRERDTRMHARNSDYGNQNIQPENVLHMFHIR